MKTIKTIIKQDREKFKVPKSVQDTIPITVLHEDGVFQVGKNKFSKTFRFDDVNYAVASDEDKDSMFKQYSRILNSYDSGVTVKLTINNRKFDRDDFVRHILISGRADGLDHFRKEYNTFLLKQTIGSNAVIQDRYITISTYKKDVEDARVYFARAAAELSANFSRLGSRCVELSALDRLRILYDFYHLGDKTRFQFNLKSSMRKGHSFKDYICTDGLQIESDHLIIGNKFARVFFLKDYASFVTDDLLSSLTGISRNLMLSIDVIPIPTHEAVKEAENRLLGVETNVTNWQRRQNANNNFSAIIPYDMEQQRLESREFLEDLTTRDQKMMQTCLTMVHVADSKKQLDVDTDALHAIAGERACQLGVLRFQQLEGLNTVLPIGVRQVEPLRTLTTEALAVQIPFNVQDVRHEHGIYYGQNIISRNTIVADRRKLQNGNSFILGVSGSGKSFAAKNEIVFSALSTDADIIVIDPEHEYSALIQALGGEVIDISAGSENHINPLDMNVSYGEANPIIEKSQFMQSLCEQAIAGHKFMKGQQSIIDRVTEQVYRFYMQGNFQGTPPTLEDFYYELLKQPEPEAKALALDLELFTRGSLNTFAKQTNVDVHSRIVCYDIHELSEQLRGIGMLIILDNILNRITRNRKNNRQTFVFIDEVYLLFMHEYSAQFLFKLWKRVRKYGAYITGITQNMEDLLQSHTARTMLSNSEFLIILNQAATDREELARLLNISDDQIGFITNADVGSGLIKVGSALVPFKNDFPKDTQLYRLMTTKPEEAVYG